MTVGFKNWWLAVTGGVFTFLSLVLGWSYFYSVTTPAVHPTTYNELVPSYGRPGEVIKLCRSIEFTRSVDVDVRRAMVMKEFGSEIRIELPGKTPHREPGIVTQCRPDFGIPEIAVPGEWTVETTVSYKDFGIWDRTVKMPDLHLEVLP